MDEAERKATVSLSEDMKKLIEDKIIKIKVCETSRLKLDPNVMHPFVKYFSNEVGCTSSIRTLGAIYKMWKRLRKMQFIMRRH